MKNQEKRTLVTLSQLEKVKVLDKEKLSKLKGGWIGIEDVIDG